MLFRFKISPRLVALASLALIGVAAQAQIHVISPYPGDAFANIQGMSGDGKVVFGFSGQGYSYQALTWTEASGTQRLAYPSGGIYYNSQATCSNYDGSVIGGSLIYNYIPSAATGAPVKWTNGTLSFLAPLDPNTPSGAPTAASADGSVIVGAAWSPSTAIEASRWDPSGITMLYTPSTYPYSDALAVSGDGSIVAGFYQSNNSFHALTVTSGVTTILPGLSALFTNSEAIGISADGSTVIGAAYDDHDVLQPVRWTSSGIQPLGSFGPENFGGSAIATNSDGTVIMLSSEGTECIWTPSGGLVDLKDYLISKGVHGLANVTNIFATCMSQDGTAFAGQLQEPSGYISFYLRIGEPDVPPVAYAGPDQVVEATGALTQVTLDGTGSYDSAGDVITYAWSEGANQLGTNSLQTAYLPEGNHTITLTVTDTTTNETASSTVHVNVRDTTPPVVTLNGGATVFVLQGNAFGDPGATANDTVDGSLPVIVSGSVNTSVVGTYTLTYSATDSSNNVGSATRTVKVGYNWSNFLQPINDDGSSIFKLGSTVPVKFQLIGASSGATITAHLYLAQVSGSVIGTEVEAVSTAAADTGNQFRYTGGQYVFNLSTKGLSTGTWQLRVDLGDGVLHTVLISLK